MTQTREQLVAGEDLLTTEELAKRWDVTERSLRSWRGDGQGPPFISLGKNKTRYRIADVLAYEQRLQTGGELPARAVGAMQKAASILSVIENWKMRPETLEVVRSARIGLSNQLKGST